MRRSSHTPLKVDDNDTVSTSELLDLIEADVVDPEKRNPTKNNNGEGRRGGGGIGGGGGGGGGGANPSSYPHGRRGNIVVVSSGRDNDTMISSLDDADPFSVRLVPQRNPARRRRRAAEDGALFGGHNDHDDGDSGEEDDSVGDMGGFDSYKYKNNRSSGGKRNASKSAKDRSSSSPRNRDPPPAARKNRQRMPLGGGYGGMFETGTARAAPREHGGDAPGGTPSSVDGDDGSSVASALTFASRFFTAKKRRRGATGSVDSNPYSTSSRPDAPHPARHGPCLVGLARSYLALPFRLRYFVQLFALVGVLMLASLNYFIAMDAAGPPARGAARWPPPSSFSEVGGGSPRQLPRLRVRDPLQFLHRDLKSNALLERAAEKFRLSTRFGGDDPRGRGGPAGNGPFRYGWKSMPRQVFHDYATGLSDDGRTIAHGSAVRSPEAGERPPPKGTVVYVFPVVACRGAAPNHPRTEEAFRDVALMLRAAVHAHSWRNPASGSEYDCVMRAVVHPQAKKCGAVDRSVLLQDLGYDVAVLESPLTRESLSKSKYLREHVGQDEGAGELADLIALHAYELEEYDAVALVDHNTLILGPVDEAVDLIVDSSREGGGTSIQAVFAWEHLPSLVDPGARVAVINLSFFLLRPSKRIFADLVARYREVSFSEGRGWGSLGRGSFAGWMTTRGFLTYYYDEEANAGKVEVNRCAFGNAGAGPAGAMALLTNEGRVECGEEGAGDAATENSQCHNCGQSKLGEVSVADLSYCRAPWMCGDGGGEAGADAAATPDALASGLCRQFQQAWFGGRLQMEDVHPQLEKGSGTLCIDGQYQPMVLLKPIGK